MASIRCRAGPVLKLTVRSPFGVHSDRQEGQVVEDGIPPSRCELVQLLLRFVEGGGQRLKLRREDDLQRQLGTETHAILQMGAQLLIWPVPHVIYQRLPIKREGYPVIRVLMEVQRLDRPGLPAIPNTASRARQQAVLAQSNCGSQARLKRTTLRQKPKVVRGVAPPVLQWAPAARLI